MKNMYNKIDCVIECTENEKHRFILALLFRLRLSTGQIVNLQVRDIRGNVLYSRGRRVYIPDSLMHEFYGYIEGKDQKSYILYSNRNKKYSIRSIQEIRKSALKRLMRLCKSQNSLL